MSFSNQWLTVGRLLLSILPMAATLFSVHPAHAERVVIANAKIYTADLNHPWADTLVIDNGRVVSIGSRPRPGSQVIDLKGHLVIPGIIDSHVHSLFGSMAFHGLNLWSPERSVTADQSAAG